MITRILTGKWAKRGGILLIIAAIIGMLVWSYCLQPSVTLSFEKASREESYEMTLAGKPFDMPYRVYAPEDAGPGQSYPVFLWLCGSAQCGTDNYKQAAYDVGIVDALIETENPDYRCIIVAPQIPEEPLSFNEEILAGYMAVVDEVQTKYHADKSRLYVAGFSMGGDEVWELVDRYPGKIAAAVPICGGVGVPSHAERFKDVAIWIFHGRFDLVYSVKRARAMNDALETAGADVRYTEYPYSGHVCWHLAYEDPGLLPWMFAQHKAVV